MLPDREIEVQDQVIDGEHVVSRWVARGTNRGRRATLTGITISEIADGKIVVRSSPVALSRRRLLPYPVLLRGPRFDACRAGCSSG
jgi:SnoaL-like domain